MGVTHNLFYRFLINIFGGSIIAFGCIWFSILKFGFDPPGYTLIIILLGSALGVFLSKKIHKKTNYTLGFINIAALAIVLLTILFFVGFEDYIFGLLITLLAILYTTFSALLIAGITYIKNKIWTPRT